MGYVTHETYHLGDEMSHRKYMPETNVCELKDREEMYGRLRDLSMECT
jgi:hypothetical protein